MKSTTILLGWLALWPALPGAAPLETAAAESAVLALTRAFDATVEAVNESTVAAEVAGTVEEIPYDVDDYVPAGAVIIRFRDNEPRARVAAARAALEEAQAGLARAEQEFARVRDVYERRLIAKSALDDALAQRDTTRARVDAARARLEELEVQLANTVVRAPYSGIVKQRHVEIGELAQPGQPLMTGLSLEQLRVSSRVPQSVVPALRDGAPIHIDAWGRPALPLEQRTLFPYADPATHTVTLRADLPAGESGFYPGMYVKLVAQVGEEERLTVPEAAVLRRSELTAVYVVGADGRVALRQVRLGRLHDGRRVIHAGLSVGERVALDPIRAGAELKAQLAGAAR